MTRAEFYKLKNEVRSEYSTREKNYLNSSKNPLIAREFNKIKNEHELLEWLRNDAESTNSYVGYNPYFRDTDQTDSRLSGTQLWERDLIRKVREAINVSNESSAMRICESP